MGQKSVKSSVCGLISRHYLYLIHSNPIRDNSGGIFPVEKSRIGKEWGKEFNGTTRNFAI